MNNRQQRIAAIKDQIEQGTFDFEEKFEIACIRMFNREFSSDTRTGNGRNQEQDDSPATA